MAVVQAAGTTDLGITAVSLNHLLTWMSARGAGSWSQFRAAVEELHVEPSDTGGGSDSNTDTTASELPVYQAVRLDLERLAHVEFYSSTAGADWRVVPPALAVHREAERWVGILCGARPPGLHDRVRSEAVVWNQEAAPDMPDRIYLVATELAALETVCRAAGVHFQLNAPLSLLAAVPPVDDRRTLVPATPPSTPGWTVETFSPSTLRWTARDRTDERDLELRDMHRCQTGLFRLRMKYQRFHYLRWRGRTYGVPVQVGKYAILRHRRVRGLITYAPSRTLLSLPVSCRPPLLIERALILSTGLLPNLDTSSRRLQYAVPRRLAHLAAGLLRQEIRVP